MENMIKVRAMRAAGIACFLVLAIIGAWPAHLLQDLLPIISGNG